MNEVFFSIDASIVLNGKNIRGTLSIDTQKIKFVSNGSVLLEKVIIWDKLEYTVKKEKVRKFLVDMFDSSTPLERFQNKVKTIGK